MYTLDEVKEQVVIFLLFPRYAADSIIRRCEKNIRIWSLLVLIRDNMKTMKKKIILFSPNGYVGSYIKENIQRDNALQLYEMTRNSDLEQYVGDYDIMIYSASITSARHATAYKYVQDNVVTAVSVVDFCRKHSIKRIIYLSSDEVFGELSTEMATERSPMVNPNIYGTTKYLAEKIIADSGIAYYILRMPGIVGRVWGKNFIYSLMDRICNNDYIELYNMKKKFNNILDIDDLTDFIGILCNCEIEGKNEIFLLGNMEKIELEDIVFYMKELYHSTSQIVNIHANQRRYFTLDVATAVQYGYSSKKIWTIIDELFQLRKG